MANRKERGTRDTSITWKQSGLRLRTLIRPKKIESRWKQYISIQILIVLEQRLLYSLIGKNSFKAHKKLMFVFLLWIQTYCFFSKYCIFSSREWSTLTILMWSKVHRINYFEQCICEFWYNEFQRNKNATTSDIMFIHARTYARI